MYPIYEDIQKITVDKEKISKGYKKLLCQDMEKRMLYLNNSKNIDLNIVLMGYSDLQLRKLYELNGIEDKALKDDEVIMYNQTLTSKGVKGYPIGIESLNDISIVLGNEKESKSNMPIKHKVEELLMYPGYGGNLICFIVNEDTYRKIKGVQYPDTYYLKIIDETKFNKEWKSLMFGNDFLEISTPKEDEKNVKYQSRILKLIILCIFIIVILICILAIMVVMYSKVSIKEDEYAVLIGIGLEVKEIVKMYFGEIIIMFLGSIILSVLFTYIGTKWIHRIYMNDLGMFLYEFPFQNMLFGTGVIASLILLEVQPMIKKISSIDVVRVLKKVQS